MVIEHQAVILWDRHGAVFTDNRYGRGHVWSFDGGLSVPASASPHIVSPPLSVVAAIDPEEAFVAALSSCHMLWFLSIACARGFVVDAYRDEAVGTLSKTDEGKQAMTRVTLRPAVQFSGEQRPAAAALEAMHHEAHERCFIANSVTTDVRCEPVDWREPAVLAPSGTPIPFAPRPTEFLGITAVKGYRLKTYSIVHGARALDTVAFAAGLERAAEELPQPARAPGRPGLGFAIFHQGQTGDYTVLGWWDQENELPLRVFVRESGAWRPARGSESICVWDLEILWRERCAYVETVLAGTVEGADEAYLASGR